MDTEYIKKWYPLLGRLIMAGVELTGFDPGVSCLLDGQSMSFGSLEAKFVDDLLKKVHPELADDEVASEYCRKHFEEKK